jgi:hypothetical protein
MTTTLTTSEWLKAVSGSFDLVANWSPTSLATGDTGGIPGPDSEVFLDPAGAAYTVTSSVNNTIDFLSTNANATLAIAAGLFTVDSPVNPYSNAYNLGAIDIDAGATMLFGAPDTPGDSAEIFNNGKVNIAGGATTAATLEIGAPWFELNGSGSVILSADAVIKADLTGANGLSSTLDNETNTISGSGTIGNGSASIPVGEGLILQNDARGTINANAAAALTLNTGTNAISNAGTIETTGAGGLNIDSTLYQQGQLIAAGTGALRINNAEVEGGGTVSVAKGGSVLLNNGILSMGGTISIAAGGSFGTTAGNTAAIGTNNSFTGDVLTDGDIENAGAITIANDSTLNFNASLYNRGAMTLAGSTGPTKLEIYGSGAAIYGIGSLVLSNSVDNSIVSNGAGVQFSNYSNISGAGTIGDTWLRLFNSTVGVVNANDSVRLTIIGDGAAVAASSESADYNAGVVETTGAGGLTISGDFGNAGDVEAIGTGALVLKDGTIADGGILRTTTAAASIVLDNYTSVDNDVDIFKGSKLSTTAGDTDTLANVFNNGTINVANGSTVLAQNNWDNTGVVDLNGAGAATATAPTTSLEVDGGLTLAGGGIVDLTDLANAHLNAITGDPNNPNNGGIAYLSNVNNTIEGAGVIGALNGASNLNLTNEVKATIDATGAAGAALTLDTGAQQIYNDGKIETTGAGGLAIDGAGDSNLNGGAMQQDGTLIADGAGALNLNTAYVQGDGSAAVAVKGASIVLNNSTLNLQGTISTVAGSSILAKGGADEIDAGEIDNAGAITVADNNILSLSGTINNTGAIDLSSVGEATGLAIEGSGVSISGAGSLVLSNNANNSIVGGNAMFAEQFDNSSNISGAGTIGGGADGLFFDNLSGGVVNATGSAVTVDKVTTPAPLLTIDGDNGGPNNINAGLIETTGAGGLTITGALENSGALDAVGKGALSLNGVTINDGGGVVQTTAAGASIVLDNTAITTGSVTVAAGSSLNTTAGDTDTLQTNVVNHGTINVANGSTLIASSNPGSWTNKGAINLNGTATATALEINGSLSLIGGGTVNLAATDTLNSIVSDVALSAFLTNVNDTIKGAGVIGDGAGTTTFNLNNAVNGVIDATGGTGAPLTLDTGTNAINNAGTIETTGAGGLNIDSWVYLGGTLIADGPGALTIFASTFVQDNQFTAQPSGGGTVVQGNGSVEAAVAGASIVLSDSSLNINGTVSTVKGSSIVALTGTTDEIDDGNDIENAGGIVVDDAATLYLNAWINNSGTVSIGDAAGSGSATLEIDGWGAQIFGTGSLVLGDNAGNLIEGETGLSQEYFYNSGIISGAGTIGSVDLSFQNLSGGVVDANDGVKLTIVGDTAVSNGLSADYNAGVIETTGAGGLTILGTPVSGLADFINAGIIDAAGVGALTLNAVTDTTGGGEVETTGSGSIVLVNGSTIASGFVMISAGGSLSTSAGDTGLASDAVEASVFNQGAINVVDDSTLVVDAHWQNSGSVNLDGSTDPTSIVIKAGNTWELLGDGTLNLTGSNTSIASGGAGATLDNIGNKIDGAGAVGDGNMTIDNHTGATIDATTGGLTIDATPYNSGTKTSYIYNAGVIQSDSAGGVTIESAMSNFGELIANTGFIDAQDAVFGNGVAKINGSGSIEFGAEADNDVIFGANATGTLILDKSTNTASDPFNGSISGFGVGDTIDLRDFAYNGATPADMAIDPAHSSSGTLDAGLTFTNGTTDSANFYFLGNYTSAYLSAHNEAFAFGDDGRQIGTTGSDGTTIKLVSTV